MEARVGEIIPNENSTAGVLYDLRRDIKDLHRRIDDLEKQTETINDNVIRVGHVLNAILGTMKSAGWIGRLATDGVRRLMSGFGER